MPEQFRPREILATLAHHDVRYVLIGGLAATLHGSSANTNDADICPERSPENLERLAAALRDMDARIRAQSEPDGLTFACDGIFLSRIDTALNLVTRFGDFDLSFRPAAFEHGYEDLAPRAVSQVVNGVSRPIVVAALADIIVSKEAANRPKDHATLPILKALEDELAAQERPTGP